MVPLSQLPSRDPILALFYVYCFILSDFCEYFHLLAYYPDSPQESDLTDLLRQQESRSLRIQRENKQYLNSYILTLVFALLTWELCELLCEGPPFNRVPGAWEFMQSCLPGVLVLLEEASNPVFFIRYPSSQDQLVQSHRGPTSGVEMAS